MPPRKGKAALPAPRPELLALLDAVKDRPSDPTPRLILADWLEERGNPLDGERAQLIRQRVHETEWDRDRRDEAAADKARLERWLGPILPFAAGAWLRLGLPELRFRAVRFMSKDLQPLLATEEFAFVQRVRLQELGAGRAAKFAALSGLAHVAEFDCQWCPLGEGSAAFAGSPYLTGVRRLGLSATKFTDAGMVALAGNPALSRLREIDLSHCAVGDNGLAALAGSPHLRNLESFCISSLELGDDGVKALASSPVARSLRRLWLRGRRLGLKGIRAVAASRHLGNVERLSLSPDDLEIGDQYEAARLLLGSERLPKVAELDLSSWNLVGEEGAAVFRELRLPGLKTLTAHANAFGDAGFKVLARCTGLGRLTALHLRNTGLGDEGAKALARSPHLEGLQELDVGFNPMGKAGRAALRKRFGERVVLD